jgi:hypothetical protein
MGRRIASQSKQTVRGGPKPAKVGLHRRLLILRPYMRIANKFINLLSIPSSLSRSYSTFLLCSGDNLNWNSCIYTKRFKWYKFKTRNRDTEQLKYWSIICRAAKSNGLPVSIQVFQVVSRGWTYKSISHGISGKWFLLFKFCIFESKECDLGLNFLLVLHGGYMVLQNIRISNVFCKFITGTIIRHWNCTCAFAGTVMLVWHSQAQKCS